MTETFLMISEPFRSGLLLILIASYVAAISRKFSIENPFQALLGLAFVLMIVGFVAPWVVVAGMMGLGLASIYLSKSGRNTLVQGRGFLSALFDSAIWAITLTIGCLIGSSGLALGLAAASNGSVLRAARSSDGWAAWNAAGEASINTWFDWLAPDAVPFALQLGLLVFVGNRMSWLRSGRGGRWLAILPPASASIVAFVIERSDAIKQFLRTLDPSDLDRLLTTMYAEFISPFEAILRAMMDPEWGFDNAMDLLINSEASYFRLATYFPWLFLLIGAAFAVRHIFGGDWSADSTA